MWWAKIVSEITKCWDDETGIWRINRHAGTIENKASWTYLKLEGIKRHFSAIETLKNCNCTILKSIAFIKNITSPFTEAIIIEGFDIEQANKRSVSTVDKLAIVKNRWTSTCRKKSCHFSQIIIGTKGKTKLIMLKLFSFF